jgi:outer membrane protein assembly factor BamB
VNNDPNSGLDRIWPGVRAEIESARRKQAFRRKATRVAAVSCLVVAVGAVALIGFKVAVPEVWAFHPWQLQDISSEIGVSADYPLTRGKHIFVVHGHGDHQHIACIEKRTGAMLWTNATSFSKCRLAADGQRVYVLASTQGANWICAALNARNGTTLWSQPSSQTPAAPPSTLTVLRAGLCWSEGNRVVLREPATGRLVWSKPVGSGGLLSAPVQQGTALFTASLDTFYALSLGTGEVLWSQPLADRTPLAAFSRPMLEAGDSRIYYASRDGQGKGVLRCIETGTRKVLWTQGTEVPVKLHFHGERVFVRSQDLNAFDARTGQPLWQVAVGGCGTLSFRGDRVYLVDAAERSRVLALDGGTGKQVWTQTVAGSCNGIIVTGRMGILSGNDRTLYAFALNEQS